MEKVNNFEEFIKNKTQLISAFPWTGKSHFFKNSTKNVLDSDSSTFDKSDFPNNYIKHIQDNIGKADVILISSHKDVREALVKNDLRFTLVYPQKDLKEEYLERYKQRGSPEGFIKLLKDNWDNWIDEMNQQENCQKIVLGKGEFISDFIWNFLVL